MQVSLRKRVMSCLEKLKRLGMNGRIYLGFTPVTRSNIQ